MHYETESTIREKVTDALRRKRQALKQPFDTREIDTPEYRKWVQDRIDDARRGKRLLTEQQHADLLAHRELQQDDRVRFVGESRLELSPASGRQILRPKGQVGTVAQVQRGAGGRPIFTFMPEIPKQTLDYAEAADVEVMVLITAEWTDLERIV